MLSIGGCCRGRCVAMIWTSQIWLDCRLGFGLELELLLTGGQRVNRRNDRSGSCIRGRWFVARDQASRHASPTTRHTACRLNRRRRLVLARRRCVCTVRAAGCDRFALRHVVSVHMLLMMMMILLFVGRDCAGESRRQLIRERVWNDHDRIFFQPAATLTLRSRALFTFRTARLRFRFCLNLK